MKRINRSIRGLIKKYHEYQGDVRVRPMRYIEGPRSTDVILVRVDGSNGNLYSVLDMVMTDIHGNPYISELNSVVRECEDDLIAWFKEG